MVGVFRRSLSFPNKINPSRPSPSSKPSISHHTRSISLPCRSHPLISHLMHDISQIRSWSSSSAAADVPRTTTWLSEGLDILKEVHDSLAEILHLPQSQESLRNRPVFFERLLEDLLRFIDAYGIFQTSVLALREHQSAAQVALRKKDDVKITSYVKSREKIARDIARLASAIRCVKTKQDYLSLSAGSFGDAELVSVIDDVISVTVSVSVALFNGVCSGFSPSKTASTLMGLLKREKKEKTDEGIEELKQVDLKSLRGLRKKKDDEVKSVMKRMRELENCICEIENGSERVFRSLINTRVSLLNVLTA